MLSAYVSPAPLRSSEPVSNAFITGATPAACTPSIFPDQLVTPIARIDSTPLCIPAIEQPSPTLALIHCGGSSASCSASSMPPDFFPSTRYGLIAALRLYQPNASHAWLHSSYACAYDPCTWN